MGHLILLVKLKFLGICGQKFVRFINNVAYQLVMPEEKAFTWHCGASFKTDQELHDHFREHTD